MTENLTATESEATESETKAEPRLWKLEMGRPEYWWNHLSYVLTDNYEAALRVYDLATWQVEQGRVEIPLSYLQACQDWEAGLFGADAPHFTGFWDDLRFLEGCATWRQLADKCCALLDDLRPFHYFWAELESPLHQWNTPEERQILRRYFFEYLPGKAGGYSYDLRAEWEYSGLSFDDVIAYGISDDEETEEEAP